jgi:aminoglycoside phosphotransferase (APT) family kinase protein
VPARTAPEPLPLAVVHDYRLGNAMVAPEDPTRILAVLDWEMGAVGDPRADRHPARNVASLEARVNPLGASPATATAGFRRRPSWSSTTASGAA